MDRVLGCGGPDAQWQHHEARGPGLARRAGQEATLPIGRGGQEVHRQLYGGDGPFLRLAAPSGTTAARRRG
eukprot:7583152-Pyramimonas_sp.AAC.1